MILCTFPGKFGDLLWALPTIRALSRRVGHGIHLLVSDDMASIVPLLSRQDYLAGVVADPEWIRVHIDTEDRLPQNLGRFARFDQVFHLGYRGWPQRPLPFETLDCLNDHWAGVLYEDADLDLATPWITDPVGHPGSFKVVHGFSDDHFELKYGLVKLLECHPFSILRIGRGDRWITEGFAQNISWERTVMLLQNSSVFLGCNSGLHVLAVACGTPVVMMEPSPARHNPIFFPLGTTGPQVTLVLGNDGLPTWDARHVADTLQRVLTAQKDRT